MNTSTSRALGLLNAFRTRWAGIAVALPLLMCSGCAMYEHALRPDVPLILQVPTGHKLLLPAYTKGVQIYRCEPSPTDSARLVWTLKGPEAMLFDNIGAVIGSHYAGPTWENDSDHSKVVGIVTQHVAAPRSGTIPWLLLQAKTNEGPGLFQRITFIQRVNTKGGLSPTTSGIHVGQEVRVPYTADYYFYRAQSQKRRRRQSALLGGAGWRNN